MLCSSICHHDSTAQSTHHWIHGPRMAWVFPGPFFKRSLSNPGVLCVHKLVCFPSDILDIRATKFPYGKLWQKKKNPPLLLSGQRLRVQVCCIDDEIAIGTTELARTRNNTLAYGENKAKNKNKRNQDDVRNKVTKSEGETDELSLIHTYLLPRHIVS